MIPDATDSTSDSAREIVCIACGYSLRGLPPGGNCPECGASVAYTLEQRLQCLAPGTLRKYGIGCVISAWCSAVGCLTAIAMFFAYSSGSAGISEHSPLITLITNAYSYTPALGLVSTWLLTASPGRALRKRSGKLSDWTRTTEVIAFAMLLSLQADSGSPTAYMWISCAATIMVSFCVRQLMLHASHAKLPSWIMVLTLLTVVVSVPFLTTHFADAPRAFWGVMYACIAFVDAGWVAVYMLCHREFARAEQLACPVSTITVQ